MLFRSKELEAKKGEVDLRITSRTRIAAERGYELEDVLDELQQEEGLMAEMGLKASAAPAQPMPAEPEVEDDDLAKALRMLAEVLHRQQKTEIQS